MIILKKRVCNFYKKNLIGKWEYVKNSQTKKGTPSTISTKIYQNRKGKKKIQIKEKRSSKKIFFIQHLIDFSFPFLLLLLCGIQVSMSIIEIVF